MTERQLILVRYGELGLKGKNKYKFINTLHNNMSRAVAGLAGTTVKSGWGRLWAESAEPQAAIDRLRMVFGIFSLSPVLQVEKNIEALAAAAYQAVLAALPQGGSFKVETRRADKTFPSTSPEISRQVASEMFNRLDGRYTADMHNPQRTIWLEIRAEGAFVYGEVLEGAGGLPVGTGGKALLLLSGGIDSPVAGWMMAKRGIRLLPIHFVSPPYTGERALLKVKALCQKLAPWCGRQRLHTVPFTEIQEAIRQHCPESLFTLIMRRQMMHIARDIAVSSECGALITGESVGQVASQTLAALTCTGEPVDIPILRPVIGMDKEEIITVARKIDTFETSILPYEDCCTVFTPRHPKTRPTLAEVLEAEAAVDWEPLRQAAIAGTAVETIG
jgi:thiamine biosynthesis protein ThiI